MMKYLFAMLTGTTSVTAYYLVRSFAVILVSPSTVTDQQISAMSVEGGLFMLFFICAIMLAVGIAADRLK